MPRTRTGTAPVAARRTSTTVALPRRAPPGGTTVRYQRVAPRPLSIALYSAFAGGVASFVLPATLAWANPQGQQVVRGSATFQNNGNTLTVTNTPGAAINWQSFSIQKNETTHFQQANSASSVLNRVVANNPSELLGNLTSNGKVVLINPFGITVGRGAAVDTAGFTASTLNITDADWANGKLRFKGNALSGDVKVDGVIRSPNGDVMLFAPNVSVGSEALIKADNGNVIIGAGQKVEVTGRGLEGIRFEIQSADNKAVNLGRIEGNAVGVFAGTLRHSGSITAQTAAMEGGKVVLRAIKDIEISGPAVIKADGAAGKSGGQISISSASGDVVVGTGARITANGGAGAAGGSVSVAAEQGKLVVEPSSVISADGSPAGSVRLFGATQAQVAGVVTAASPVRTDSPTHIEPVSLAFSQAVGGKVEVLGEEVRLQAGAQVDVSGDGGGGIILIGGDFQGANADVRNAKNTNVAPGVVLTADGRAQGDGGRVIVWADNDTNFSGTISAKGGLLGGDGGFAETSGKHNLYYRGRTNLTAPRGRTGTLLLDPDAIVIMGGSQDGDDNPDGNAGTLNNGSGLGTVAGGTGSFTIYESEIEGTEANVYLMAANSISVLGTFTGGASGELTIQPGYHLRMQVTNATSGTHGIDLTGSDSGVGLVVRASYSGALLSRGTITLETTSASSNGGVKVGSLITDGGAVSIQAQGAVTIGLSGEGGIDTSSTTTLTGGGSVTIQSKGDVNVYGGIKTGTLAAIGGVIDITAQGGLTDGKVNVYGTLSTNNNGINITGWSINTLSGATAGQINAGLGGVNLVASGVSLSTFNGGVAVDFSTSIKGHTIAISADRFYMHSSAAGITGTSSVSIAPFSAARGINIGGSDDLATTFLGITQTENAKITTPLLRIGSISNTGAIDITQSFSRPGDTLSLATQGAISQPVLNPITVDKLMVRGSTANLLSQNTVSTFAGMATDAGLYFRNAGSFTVGTADFLTMTSAGSTGQLVLQADAGSSTITLASDVKTAGAHMIFAADRIQVGNATVNSVTIDSNSSATGAGGNIDFLGDITAAQSGRALLLDASMGGAGNSGGNVSLRNISNVGGAYLSLLDIDSYSDSSNGTVSFQAGGSTLSLRGNGTGIANQASLSIRNARLFVGNNATLNTNAAGGTLTAGGHIDIASAVVFGDANHRSLTLLADGGINGDGGTVRIGSVSNFFGDHIGELHASAVGNGTGAMGQVQLFGDIATTSSSVAAASGDVRLYGNVVLYNDVNIRTSSQTDASSAGSVFLGTSGGEISSVAPGKALNVDTSAATIGINGGNIFLWNAGNGEGQYLNKLTINAGGDTNGVVYLNAANISLAAKGTLASDQATLAIQNAHLWVNANATLDTNAAGATLTAGGVLDLETARVGGTNTHATLVLKANGGTDGDGGNIKVGEVAAFSDWLGGLTASALGKGTGLIGTVELHGDIATTQSTLSPATGNVVLDGNVVLYSNVNIFTSTETFAPGAGSVLIGTLGGSVSAAGKGRTLNINTSSANLSFGGTWAGDVSLPTIGNAGDNYLQGLLVTAKSNTSGESGIVKLNGDVRLDRGTALDGAEATLSINAGYLEIYKPSSTLTIDTLQSTVGSGGGVVLKVDYINATSTGTVFSIDTSTPDNFAGRFGGNMEIWGPISSSGATMGAAPASVYLKSTAVSPATDGEIRLRGGGIQVGNNGTIAISGNVILDGPYGSVYLTGDTGLDNIHINIAGSVDSDFIGDGLYAFYAYSGDSGTVDLSQATLGAGMGLQHFGARGAEVTLGAVTSRDGMNIEGGDFVTLEGDLLTNGYNLTVTAGTGTLSVMGNVRSIAPTGDANAGGNITLTSNSSSVVIANGKEILSQGGEGDLTYAGGAGGSVSISGASLSIGNNVLIASRGGRGGDGDSMSPDGASGGDAGGVTVTSGGAIGLGTGASIYSLGGDGGTGYSGSGNGGFGGSGGKGGSLLVSAGSGTLTVGATSTLGSSGGAGGAGGAGAEGDAGSNPGDPGEDGGWGGDGGYGGNGGSVRISAPALTIQGRVASEGGSGGAGGAGGAGGTGGPGDDMGDGNFVMSGDGGWGGEGGWGGGGGNGGVFSLTSGTAGALIVSGTTIGSWGGAGGAYGVAGAGGSPGVPDGMSGTGNNGWAGGDGDEGYWGYSNSVHLQSLDGMGISVLNSHVSGSEVDIVGTGGTGSLSIQGSVIESQLGVSVVARGGTLLVDDASSITVWSITEGGTRIDLSSDVSVTVGGTLDSADSIAVSALSGGRLDIGNDTQMHAVRTQDGNGSIVLTGGTIAVGNNVILHSQGSDGWDAYLSEVNQSASPGEAGGNITLTSAGSLSIGSNTRIYTQGGTGGNGISEPGFGDGASGGAGGTVSISGGSGTLLVGSLSTIASYGGRGGNGARGYDGADGSNASSLAPAGGGQAGQNGGSGGGGGEGGTVLISAPALSISGLVLSHGGLGGDANSGGDGGKGGDGFDDGSAIHPSGDGGKGGNAGSAGSGGMGGTVSLSAGSAGALLLNGATISSLGGSTGATASGGIGGVAGTAIGSGGSGTPGLDGTGDLEGNVGEAGYVYLSSLAGQGVNVTVSQVSGKGVTIQSSGGSAHLSLDGSDILAVDGAYLLANGGSILMNSLSSVNVTGSYTYNALTLESDTGIQLAAVSGRNMNVVAPTIYTASGFGGTHLTGEYAVLGTASVKADAGANGSRIVVDLTGGITVHGRNEVWLESPGDLYLNGVTTSLASGPGTINVYSGGYLSANTGTTGNVGAGDVGVVLVGEDGVDVQSGATVSASGTGSLSFSSTSGDVDVAGTVSAGTGAILVTAGNFRVGSSGKLTSSGQINVDSAGIDIQGSINTGKTGIAVILKADSLDLGAPGAVAAASGTVVIMPATSGHAIDVALTNDGPFPGALHVKVEQLNNNISAAVVQLGNADMSGGDVTFHAAVNPALARTLAIYGENITQDAFATLDVDGLMVQAAGAVELTRSGNNIDAVAGLSGAGFDFRVTSSSNMTVSTVAGFGGIDAGGGASDSSVGLASEGGTITISAAVSGKGGINPAGVYIIANDLNIDATGSINARGTAFSINPYNASRPLDLGGTPDAGEFNLTAAELGRIGSYNAFHAGNALGGNAFGDIQIGAAVSFGSAGLVLNATGVVSQGANAITAGGLHVDAAGVSLGSAANVLSTGHLGGTATSGDFAFKSTGTIRITDAGITAGGAVSLESTSGSIVNNSSTGQKIVSTLGNMTLKSGAGLGELAGNGALAVRVGGQLTATVGTGDARVTSDSDLSIGAVSSSAGVNGIYITTTGSGKDLTIAGASTGDDSWNLQASGDMVLGASGSIGATTATLTAGTGSIRTMAATGTSAAVSGVLKLNAATIGSAANPIRFDAAEVSASVSSGGMYLLSVPAFDLADFTYTTPSAFTVSLASEGIITVGGYMYAGNDGASTFSLTSAAGIGFDGGTVAPGTVAGTGGILALSGPVSVLNDHVFQARVLHTGTWSIEDGAALQFNASNNSLGSFSITDGSAGFGSGSSSVGSLVNSSQGTLTLGTGTLSIGTMASQGGLIDLGGGGTTLTVAAGNLVNAGTIIGAGTVNLTGAGGTLVNDSLVMPGGDGTVGVIEVLGNLAQGTAGRIKMDWASAGLHDHVSVQGDFASGGTLSVGESAGMFLAGTEQFNAIYANGSITGPLPAFESRSAGVVFSGIFPGVTTGNLVISPASITNFWTKNTNAAESWATAANWTRGHAPTIYEDAVVDVVNNPMITLSGGGNAAKSIDLRESLRIVAAASLDVGTGGLNVYSGGTMALAGGTVGGAGDFYFNSGSTLTWTGGTLAGSGTANLLAGSVANVQAGTGQALQRALDNAGTFNADDGLVLTAATLTNTGTLNLKGNGAANFSGTGTLVNAVGGTINTTTGTGYAQIGTAFSNDGLAEAGAANLFITGGGDSAGTLAIGAGRMLTLQGLAFDSTGSIVNSGGTLVMNPNNLVTITVSGGGYSELVASTVSIAGGAGGAYSQFDTALNTATLLQSNGFLTGSADITAGTFTRTAGYIGSTVGTPLFTTTGLATNSGTNYFADRHWQVQGGLNITGGYLELTAGATLTNEAGSVLDLQASYFNGAIATIGGTGKLVNDGTLRNSYRSSNSGNYISIGVSTLDNNGTIEFGADGVDPVRNLVIGSAGTYSSGSTLNIAAGKQVSLDDTGTRTFAPGSKIINNGTLRTVGGVINVGGTFANTGTVNIASGSIYFNTGSEVLFPALTLTGNIGGNDAITVTGTSTLEGNILAGSGVFKIAGGVTAASTGGFGLTARTLRNEGTLNLSGGSSSFASTAKLENAGLVQQSGTARLDDFLDGDAATVTNQSGGIYLYTSSSTDGFEPMMINQAGALLQVQSGVLSLSGGLSQSGNIVVDASTTLSTTTGYTNNGDISGFGTLSVGAGTLTNAGALRPGGTGAVGTLRINGSLNMGTGTLYSELSGPASYDVLNVTGNLVKSGTISVSEASVFVAGGEVFDVVSYGGALSGSSPLLSSAITDVGFGLLTPGSVLRLSADSVVNRWTVDTSGDWTTGINWSRGHAPNQYESAVVDRAGANTVTISAAGALAKSLQVVGDDVLSITGMTAGLSLGSGGGTLSHLTMNGGTLAGGAVAVSGTATLAGSAKVESAFAATGTVTLEGTGAYFWGGGSFTNATLDIMSSGIFFAGGSYSIADTDVIASGNAFMLANDAHVTLSGASQLGSVSLMLTDGGGQTPRLTLNNLTGSNSVASYYQSGPGSILDGSALLEVTGDFSWDGGMMSGTGTTRLNNGGGGYTSVITTTDVTTLNRTLQNQGTLEVSATGSLTIGNAGTLLNDSGASLAIDAQVSLAVVSGGAGSRLINNGLLTFNAAGAPSTTSTIAATVENNAGATLDISAGTLRLAGPLTANAGIINLAIAGSQFDTATRDYTNTATGAFSGFGTINTGTGTLTNNGAIRPGGTGAQATLTVDGNLDMGGGTLYTELFAPGSYDVLSVTGNLVKSGTLNVSEGAVFVAGGQAFDVVTFGGTLTGTTPALASSVADVGFGLTAPGQLLRLSADSVTNRWAVDSGGLWTAGVNWSRGHAPNQYEDAVIDRALAAPVVTLNTSGAQALSLAVNGDDTLRIAGPSASLTLGAGGGDVTNLVMAGGTLAGGAVNHHEVADLSGGAVVQSSFTSTGTLNISGTGAVFSGGGLLDGGTINLAGGSGISFTAGSFVLQDATISAFGDSFNVFNDAHVTLSGTTALGDVFLVIDGTTGAGGHLTLNNAGTNDIGDFYMYGANALLDGAAALTVNGDFTWSGGTIAAGGTLTVNSGVDYAINTSTATLLNRTLVIQNLLSIGGSNALELGASGTIINDSGAILFLSPDGSSVISTASTGRVINDGTIAFYGGFAPASTSAIGAKLDNNGTLQVTDGTLVLAGTLTDNAGVIDLQASSTTLSTSSRDFVNGATGSIIGFGALNLGGGTLTNNGNINPGDATSAGVLNIAGSYVQGSGGTLTIDAASTSLSDKLQVSGTAALAGTLNVGETGSYTIGYGDGYTAVTAASVGGTFTVINGPMGVTLTPVYGAASVSLYTAGGPVNNWIGTNGDWSNSANWSLGRIPATGDVVIIDPAGINTITLASAAASSLFSLDFSAGGDDIFLFSTGGTLSLPSAATLGGTLHIAGGTLTSASGPQTANMLKLSSGRLENSAAFNVTSATLGSGTVIGSGTLNVSGVLEWTTGVVNGGTLNTSGATTLANGTHVLSSALWVNTGTVTHSGGSFSLTDSVFSNQQVFINTEAGGDLFESTSGTNLVHNSGTFNWSQPGTRGSGLTPFNNDGVVNVDTGANANMQSGGSGAGSWVAASGATLQFSGGTRSMDSGANIVGAGTMLVNGGIVYVDGSFGIAGSGTVAMSGGELYLNTGGTLSFAHGVTLSSAATLDLANNTTFQSLTLNSSELTGLSSKSVNGLLTLNDGAITGGTLTTGGGASLGGANQVLSNLVWLNSGTIAHTGGALHLNNGSTLYNQSGGVFNETGSGGTHPVAVTVSSGANGFIDNAGAINWSATGSRSVSGAVGLDNTGTINLLGGTLDMAGTAGFGQSGKLLIGAGATFQRGPGFNNTGYIAGTGTIDVSGGTLTNMGTLSPGGEGAVGTLHVAGDFNMSSGTLLADLAGTASFDRLTVSGNLVQGGTLGVAENTVFIAGGNTFNVVTYGGTLAGAAPSIIDGIADVGFTLNAGSGALQLVAATVSNSWLAVSGNWATGSNWSRGHTPNSFEDAYINPLGMQVVTLSSGAQTPRSLQLVGDDTLAITGGSLGIANASTVGSSASLLLSGGVLSGSGALDVSGAFTWNGGNITAGAVNVAGVLTIGNASVKELRGTLSHSNASGLSSWIGGDNGAGGVIDIIAGGRIINQAGAVLEIATGGQSNRVGAYGFSPVGFIDNYGTLDVTGGGMFAFSPSNEGAQLHQLRNFATGVVNVTDSQLYMHNDASAPIAQLGTWNFTGSGGTALLNLYGNNNWGTGATINTSGATALAVNGPTQLYSSGAQSWATVNVTGGSSLAINQNFTVTDKMSWTGSVIGSGGAAITLGSSANTSVTSAATLSGANLVNNGTLTVGSGAHLNAGQMVTNAGLLTLGSGTLTASSGLANSGTVSGNGRLNTGGTVTSSGTITPGGAGTVGTISISGNADLSGGTMDVDLASLSSYDLLAVSGNLAQGGTLNVSESTPFISGSDWFDVFTYGGTVSGSAPMVNSSISGVVLGTSTTSAAAGALRLAPTSVTNFWLTGSGDWVDSAKWSRGHAPTSGESITVDPTGAQTVTVSSGASGLASLLLGNDDTFFITGGNFVLPMSSTLGGTLTLSGGTLTNSGASLSMAALNWESGFIGGTGSMAGALTFAGTGSRTLTGSTLTSFGSSNLSGGDLQLQGGWFGWSTGTLTVASGASLAIDGGAIAAMPLLNQGTVAVGSSATALTALDAGGTQTGRFTIASGKTLSLGSGNVTLAPGAAVSGGTWLIGAGQVSIAGTLDRGASATTYLTGGTLSVGGALTTASLSVSGGLLDGNGDLTVTDAFSQGAGSLGTSFDEVRITQQSGNLALGSVGAASVTLASLTGSIVDGNAGATNITASNVKLSASTGIDIDLDTPVLEASLGGAGTIDVNNAGALELTAVTASSGSANFVVGGPLTQSGAVQVMGPVSIDAGGAGITLNHAGNQFDGLITLVGTSAASIVDNSGLSVAGSASSLSLDSQDVNVESLTVSGPLTIVATGQISQGAAISVTGLTSLSASTIVMDVASSYAGGVTFNAANGVTLASSGALLLAGTANHAGGALSLTAAGTVSQTSALTVSGAASVSATGQVVDFGSLANDFSSVSFNAASVMLNDTNSVAIGGTVAGHVDVTAVTGVNSSGSFNFGSLDVTLTGSGSISLLDGNVSGAATFATSGGGSYQNIQYSNNSATGSIGGPILASGVVSLAFKNTGLALPQVQAGTLFVGVGGALTQTGVLSATTTELNASGFDITLDNGANQLGTLAIKANNASITDAGALNIDGEVTGALHVSAAALTQTPANALLAGSATLSGATGIALNGANALGTLAAASAGAITVNDVGASLTLGNISTPASLAVQSGGAVLQSAGATLSSGSLDMLALSIGTPEQPVNFSAPVATLYGVAGGVHAQSAQAFTLAGLVAAGNASVSSAQSLSVTGEAFAEGSMALAGQGMTVHGNVSAQSVSLNSGSGTLAIGGGMPGGVFGATAVALAGNDILVQGGASPGYSAQVISDGSISVNAAGNFVIQGGSETGTLAEVTSFGPLSVTAVGGVDVIGGSGAGAYAKLDPAAQSLLSVSAQSVTLQGGSGAGAYAAIVSEGDITVAAPGGISMFAGSGTDADAVVVSYFGTVTLPSCNGCVKLTAPPFGNGVADVGVLGGEDYLAILTEGFVATNELIQIGQTLTREADPESDEERRRKGNPDIVVEGESCK